MPMVQANIESFAQQIKMMAPLVRKVKVLCGMVGDDEEGIESKFVEKLMAQLFRLAPRIAHSLHRMLSSPVELRMDGICGLTHVDIETDDIRPALQLARQSAMTLQYLRIKAHDHGNISGLIKDTGGNYIEYRQLRVLKLDHYTEVDNENKPVAPGAVLFPHLRLLHMANAFPFGDDVLFRGNAATLEFLKMKLAREDVMMLQKHRVFTPHSHPKLQSVDVWFEEDKVVGIFSTHAARLQFLFDIVPGAAVRVFSHMS
ncbi:hypothetical protein GGF42_009429, partial [Coemansia sp. RSA 2424]